MGQRGPLHVEHSTMVTFRCSCVSLFVILWITGIAWAECDLAKIFRTPKDMSKVNFDHFEIVERNGFEPPATTERPGALTKGAKKSGANVANAQVLVRFGGDDVRDSNHVMKIPPQCRHLIGNPAPPPFYPPCHPHFYHPYPPPVPFVFPNYYFYRNEAQYLPLQLREYFRKRPEYLGDDDDLKKMDGRRAKETDTPESSRIDVVMVRPRIMKALDLSNEDIEENVARKAEAQKNGLANDIYDSSEDKLNNTQNNDHKDQKKPGKSEKCEGDLEKQLDKALVAYKCDNCSQPLKMLVSYPIVNRDENETSSDLSANSCAFCGKFSKDIADLSLFNTKDVRDGCKCLNCQCNTKEMGERRFANDLDDLIAIMYADVAESSSLYPDLIPPIIPLAKLVYLGLHTGDADCKAAGKLPLKATLGVELEDCGSAAGCGRKLETPQVSLPASPQTIVVYQAPPKARDVRYPLCSKGPSHYFFPEPNVVLRKSEEKGQDPLPKYLKVIPRDDLEIVPPRPLRPAEIVQGPPAFKPARTYCKHCGCGQSGGNFCSSCGAPLVAFSSPVAGSCCPKETRQLNDW